MPKGVSEVIPCALHALYVSRRELCLLLKLRFPYMKQYVDRACRESHVVENECAWIGYGDGSLKAAI